MSTKSKKKNTTAPLGPKGDKEVIENKMIKSVANVVSGNFLSSDKTIRKFPFILFLSFLAICYIAYGYYSDDQVRKLSKLTSEIKDLRTRFIVAKDSLVIKSKQTEIAKSLVGTGIKESVVPPKKIIVNKAMINKEANSTN